MTYDSARGRTVLFGGSNYLHRPQADTWEWDGQAWAQRTPPAAPTNPVLADFKVVYNSTRQRVVMFWASLDAAAQHQSQTWEYDGQTWTRMNPAMSPPVRTGFALAYDSTRDRVVLFGGIRYHLVAGRYQPGPDYDDTWEWDGNTWTQATPAISPRGRNGHAMAYDAARQKVVLFSGHDEGPPIGDTWTWDGATWSLVATPVSPQGRYNHRMAYDSVRQRVVMHGGQTWADFGGHLGDTWEWDGQIWIQRAQSGPSGTRILHGMTYDAARGEVLVFGGNGQFDTGADLWAWNGTDWQLRSSLPLPRYDHAMVYDSVRGSLVMFGGGGDTWERRGGKWVAQYPETLNSPPARYGNAMAFDSGRGKIVMFGGYGRADTWERDGTVWMQRTPPTSPPAQYQHAMTYDAYRRRVVLFGMHGTWLWDGQTWSSPLLNGAPDLRFYTAMAYDPNRRKVVMFGGVNPAEFLGDTWEWDGAKWTRLLPNAAPPATYGHAMAYDATRRKVVIAGGRTGDGRSGQTWEWDGKIWTRLNPTVTPSYRGGHAMAYDASLQRIVLFGGDLDFGPYAIHPTAAGDTWELSFTGTP